MEIYDKELLTEWISEQGAIRLATEFVDRYHEEDFESICCIYLISLKAIYVFKGGETNVKYYAPMLIRKGSNYMVSYNGKNECRNSLAYILEPRDLN